MSSWHASGCNVGPDDLNQVQLVREMTLASGERALEYQCRECGATHMIIADPTDHRTGETSMTAASMLPDRPADRVKHGWRWPSWCPVPS